MTTTPGLIVRTEGKSPLRIDVNEVPTWLTISLAGSTTHINADDARRIRRYLSGWIRSVEKSDAD